MHLPTNPLENRVARRLFVEFMLVLLVPLALLSLFGMRQAERQLEQQAYSHLAFSAKDAAMSVVGRLQSVEYDVEMLLGDLAGSGLVSPESPNPRLQGRLESRFRSLAVFHSLGTLELLGELEELPPLSEPVAAHLATGAMAIEVVGGTRLYLLRNLGGFDLGDGTLIGELRPESLLPIDGTQGLALMCGEGLLHTTDPELLTPDVLARAQRASTQRLELSTPLGNQFAVAREVFLRPQYGLNLTLLLAQPVAETLAPIAHFRLLFLLAALLVFLVVFFVSLKRIRANLVPVSQLHAATRRLETGDLDARLDIRTGDEFQELGEAFNAMADRVAERTRQLIEADQAKSRFLANMSHEIRTPMSSILGYAELCAAEPALPAEAREHLEVIRTSSRHLLRVINDVLDFARIEAGKLEVCALICDPLVIVSEALRIVAPYLGEKPVELRREVRGEIPARVRTDPDRLRQVLVNLLSNAVKFTAAGSITVTLEMREEAGRRRLCFEVADTGPGIGPGLRERLFRPFSLGDESMSRVHGGSGLGLSIARALAQMLGGELEYASTLGLGSVFTASIDPGEPEAPLPASAAAAPEGSGMARDEPPLRLLVAEDVQVNRALAVRFLEKAGWSVAEAENGEQAVELTLAAWHEGRGFDVVLMDMQMPVLDGYEAVRKLRSESYDGAILAFTAHAIEGERERCLAVGCDDLVTKPIVREHLLGSVRRHARFPRPFERPELPAAGAGASPQAA